MRQLVLLAFVFGLAACDGTIDEEDGSKLAALLDANTNWPYEVTGVLDIVEAGGFDENDYPTWAVGSLVNDQTDEFGISIDIEGDVVPHARINIDSGKPVRAWLEAPKMQYGVKTYPIAKLEAL
jgi:hypothetical protein